MYNSPNPDINQKWRERECLANARKDVCDSVIILIAPLCPELALNVCKLSLHGIFLTMDWYTISKEKETYLGIIVASVLSISGYRTLITLIIILMLSSSRLLLQIFQTENIKQIDVHTLRAAAASFMLKLIVMGRCDLVSTIPFTIVSNSLNFSTSMHSAALSSLIYEIIWKLKIQKLTSHQGG
jgi:hypothetical protein